MWTSGLTRARSAKPSSPTALKPAPSDLASLIGFRVEGLGFWGLGVLGLRPHSGFL